jgi:hypothetical protein
MMLGLKAHQTHVRLGLAHNRTQRYWIWQLTKSMSAWTERVVELKDIESSSSPKLYLIGLSAYL